MRKRLGSDRGASVFMVAISLFLLIGASAIAVDIAAIWLDRSTDQKVTDAAAAAGALEAVNNGGQAACETALTYVATNTPDLSSSDVDLSGCVAFNQACTTSLDVPFAAGRYDLTVVYPVEDGHDLMTSGIIGQQPQTLHEDDGVKPCERVGVKMESTRKSFFAQVLGFGQSKTSVHTVARAIPGDPRAPFNLLVLDRTGCNAISSSGGGQIIIRPVVARDSDGNPTGLVPGLAASDSDGSACASNQNVITMSGTGSLFRADGPTGCGNGPNYQWQGYPAGEGCGTIASFAPGTPGCNHPACGVGGGGNAPNPDPTPMGSRYTRELADHRWNCYNDYPWSSGPPTNVSWATAALTGNQSIDSCDDWDPSGQGNDHIYNLINKVGATGKPMPTSPWKFWQADLGRSCNVSGNPSFNENVVFDCTNLQITGSNSVTINGNAIFNKNVTVNGELTVNPPPGDDAWIFFRGGELSKQGSGRLTFNNAMVYMAKGSSVKLAGGSGRLVWTAPVGGRFDALAFWTDSTLDHSWAGQADLALEGVFFMPMAKASYSGTGGQIQTNAQWIAWRLEVSGGGVLSISPSVGRALEAVNPRTILIR